MLVVLAIIGGTAAAAFNPSTSGVLLAGGGLTAALIAVCGLAWTLLRKSGTQLLTQHLGDAARYVEAKPDNIARRQEIREAGVLLLERMHETGEYQRIVVAAHCLGSAIAYDILAFTWNRLRRPHANPGYPGLWRAQCGGESGHGGGHRAGDAGYGSRASICCVARTPNKYAAVAGDRPRHTGLTSHAWKSALGG